MNPLPEWVSRRHFLTRSAMASLGAVSLGAGLSDCSVPGLARVPVTTTVTDESRTRKVVRFANWFDYIDTTPKGGHPTLTEFTRQSGIKVDYTELFADINQPVSLIGMPLAVGKDPGYDLVVLADWVLAQFIKQGWAAELSPDLLTQAWRLLPRFRDWPVPDLRRFALPWQIGLTGIGYNARATRRPITSMKDLLTAPDLRGRVSLVSDMRDVIGLILLDQGSDPADFSTAEFRAALTMLQRSVSAGQIRAVTTDYLQPMIKGRIAAGVVWSGDIVGGRKLNPALQFIWPASGGIVWTDNMMIPALAPLRANAERLMNFYYQPDVAAQLTAFTNFISPVLGTQSAMRRIDPALVREKYVFPSDELLRTGHHFKILTKAQNIRYTAEFNAAVGL